VVFFPLSELLLVVAELNLVAWFGFYLTNRQDAEDAEGRGEGGWGGEGLDL
jgi:hypothetical protein